MSNNKNIKVNPVKATCMKFQGTNNGLVGINDTCFGICAAFSNSNNTYDMDPECSASCVELVEKRKREIYGVGSCDHQAPYRPVIWDQIPRFIPRLVRQGVDPNMALDKCMQMCDKYVPNLSKECKDHCVLDRSAIEDYEEGNEEKENKGEAGEGKIQTGTPVIIGYSITGIVIVSIIILIILGMFLFH